MSTNEHKPVPPDAPEMPVDMEQLLNLTGGEKEPLHALVELFLVQTGLQLERMAGAIRADQPAIVQHEAHSSRGASASMGVTRLTQLLLELETQGKSGALTTAATLCADAQAELLRVRDFLAIELR